MKILEYRGFSAPRQSAQYKKIVELLEREELEAAQVKKLAPTSYYRAKLNDRDRLLFTLLHCGGVRYALLLEIIENHAYDKSRFLRGSKIDDEKIPALPAMPLSDDAFHPVPYVNTQTRRLNILDKMLSFDDAQEAIYHAPLPLIIIGSAGSGKTALALEKLKTASGDVLYVTQSAFLAQHARNLYFAQGYEAVHQNVDFYSMKEYCETLRVPAGRVVDYRDFRGWFERFRRSSGLNDAHQLFEEIRGVLTGTTVDAPYLTLAEYTNLGIKQSVFSAAERPAVYAVFEKYLRWLKDEQRFDNNLLAFEYLSLVTPRYDVVAVDEVQDLTNVQLAVLLKSLKQPGQFMLSGDSNQIVHPNFFSWAKVKSLFYTTDFVDTGRVTRILQTNYRNNAKITELANRLLKIKQRRFGSIDRESNYLVHSVSANSGEVALLAEQDAVVRELNDKTKRSTRYAVLVLREDQKPEAQQRFQTPLVFSVQEAKGLEYDNVILYRFVSGERANFAAVTEGVAAEQLDEEQSYNRGKDKSDKSIETYKFYVNAFYVAMTRAVRNLYIVESDIHHPLLKLLGLLTAQERITLANETSNTEEWQREARKLELQGKVEQAAAIRETILHEKKVPWEVIDNERFDALKRQVLDPKNISGKARQLVVEYVAYYDEQGVAYKLDSGMARGARTVEKNLPGVRKKYWAIYTSRNPKDVLRETDQYGVNFRNRFNQTPLMVAAQTGNVRLVEALLDRGADKNLYDNYGRGAFHLLWLETVCGKGLDEQSKNALFPLLAPESVSLRINEKLIKLDAHIGEFLMFNAMLAFFKRKYNEETGRSLFGFTTANLIRYLAPLPAPFVRESRQRRAYLSSVLSRNEIDRDYAYNRYLFLRNQTGHYVINPAADMRVADAWVNIYDILQLDRMIENGHDYNRFFLDQIRRAREEMRRSVSAVGVSAFDRARRRLGFGAE